MKKFKLPLFSLFLLMALLFTVVSCDSTPKETPPPVEDEIVPSDTVLLNDSLLESFLEVNDLSESLSMMEAVIIYKTAEVVNLQTEDNLSDYKLQYIADLKKDIEIMSNYYNHTAVEYNKLNEQLNFGQYEQYVPEYYSQLSPDLIE
jgi:hypothetical protein